MSDVLPTCFQTVRRLRQKRTTPVARAQPIQGRSTRHGREGIGWRVAAHSFGLQPLCTLPRYGVALPVHLSGSCQRPVVEGLVWDIPRIQRALADSVSVEQPGEESLYNRVSSAMALDRGTEGRTSTPSP